MYGRDGGVAVTGLLQLRAGGVRTHNAIEKEAVTTRPKRRMPASLTGERLTVPSAAVRTLAPAASRMKTGAL